MAASLTESQLRRVYYHVFLPPQLRQASDEDTSISSDLISVTLDALKKLPGPLTAAKTCAITAIENLKDINSLPEGVVSEKDLCRILIALADGESAPIHVCCQNAAVLVTRENRTLVFEAFELSPLNSQVLAAKGRLIRSFPGAAVAIAAEQHDSCPSLPVIANTLSTMSAESVTRMQPESFKGGIKHEEHRDTADPALVTELFIGFLRGFGESSSC